EDGGGEDCLRRGCFPLLILSVRRINRKGEGIGINVASRTLSLWERLNYFNSRLATPMLPFMIFALPLI
ncbi:MAG: hypothetical protein ACKO6F_04355, partial [Cyanobium sp.]